MLRQFYIWWFNNSYKKEIKMADNFKMKSTQNSIHIDFGDGFIDCTAALPLVAAVSIEKRAGLVAQLIRANGKPAFIAAVRGCLQERSTDHDHTVLTTFASVS